MVLVRAEDQGGMSTRLVGCQSNDALFICCCTLRQHLCMRYRHGPGGIVGITLNEHALSRWALNLHICSRLIKDISDLKEAIRIEVDHHKQDSPSIINADNDDMNAIRDKLETCVDPLDVSQGQNSITIVTGKFSKTNVNVEDAVPIGDWNVFPHTIDWDRFQENKVQ